MLPNSGFSKALLNYERALFGKNSMRFSAEEQMLVKEESSKDFQLFVTTIDPTYFVPTYEVPIDSEGFVKSFALHEADHITKVKVSISF